MPQGTRWHDPARQVTSVVTFGAVVWLNGLAGSGTLSGESIGVIANRYSSSFLPADYVFSIWGLIYLALLAFATYQALPAQRHSPLLRSIGAWWPINGLLNVAWIVTFSFGRFGEAMLIMLALLASLVVIQGKIGIEDELRWQDRAFVAFPFALYLSWIAVAVIANSFQYATYLGWDFLGLGDAVWAAAMMGAATAFGGYMAWRRRSWVTPLVVAWAMAGITIRYPDVPVLSVTGWMMTLAGLFGLAASRVGGPSIPSRPGGASS